MRTRTFDPIGVEITELDLRHLDTDTVTGLQTLLTEHGVAVLRGQDIDDIEFGAFLGRFGDLTFTEGETPVDGFPDLNIISNVGRSTPPRSVFHVDTSYVARPPAYTALRAVEIPEHGGETLFTNQYRAFDTLSEELRDRLQGRRITHVMTGLTLGAGAETAAEHPVFAQHPISGRTALFLSTPQRCVAISGIEQAEAREVIESLYAHSTSPANTFRYAWAPGDVVIWDNRCVLHRADHAEVVGNRVMHRGMVTAHAGG